LPESHGQSWQTIYRYTIFKKTSDQVEKVWKQLGGKPPDNRTIKWWIKLTRYDAHYERIFYRVCKLDWAARSVESCLLNCAADLRENSTGIRANQSNRTHGDRQDHSQHHSVLCDVLTFISSPKLMQQMNHTPPHSETRMRQLLLGRNGTIGKRNGTIG
jgi:hypothetical protein